MPVRVIAGLGNPGPRYDGTRHNIGFRAVDELAKRLGASWSENKKFCAHTASVEIAGQPVVLMKPDTFMNLSGKSLGEICRFYKWKPAECVVVYDEYTLPVGRLKLSLRGSPGGHNGVADIINRLGDAFIRFRIGIMPAQKPLAPLKDFVLGRFTPDEQAAIDRALPEWLEGLEYLVRHGPERAMNQLNQKKPSPPPTDEHLPQSPVPRDGDPGHPGLQGTGRNADHQAQGHPQEPGR
ncbi:MAG: aminoacyl-tRNA hydrolase [Verrucomicrobiota bacterium JB022]|nr:aminoacyl-tRNA hydrolase [Verrucomicrobiota bacterium JB022]